jgi:hypothetical protein
MANTKPVAFISFVGSDFHHDGGGVSQFRERLADEVSMHTGEELSIFQDQDDALWAQVWKERVEESVDRAAFLITFITPRFFSTPQCRSETPAVPFFVKTASTRMELSLSGHH